MVILGMLLIMVGVIAILAALFVSEPGTGGELLGFDVTTFESFLVGVAAGAAILWGVSILKWGTKRGLAHRKERKELKKLSTRLDQVESERHDQHPATGSTDTRTEGPGSTDTGRHDGPAAGGTRPS
ncbi:hypothetical protein [Nocardioides piscis]|uniref:LapA family protein n=1 Tax=Nocardioides piscis TaxID=2714938 RepID=A0A6G7YCV1_9ACTN|nr:hypothetical protein [Nocardioides piscis]QIK74623.1 hypothetical protein G7071_03430 [Nocardioides piscis]